MAKPEELGLLLPRARTPIEIQDRHVLVDPNLLGTAFATDDGEENEVAKVSKAEPIVAKVYVEIGNRYVVIMPDGSLRSVLKREVTPTDRPFKPFTKEQLATLLKKQFRGFKTRVTRRYICVYNTSDRFCESNTTILESMYPALKAIFKRQRFDVDDPATPLVVVMFKNKAEFQRYRQMPDSLLAYYNGVNNRVFLYQWSEAAFDAPQIALRQATSTIAHEGVHQILHNIGVQKRLSDWPIWISEGLAEYFAPTTTGHRSKWKGVGKPNDLRMRELFRYLKGVEGLGSGNLVQHILTTDQLSSAEYAVAWALTHYLATRKKDELFEYIKEVSESGPLAQGTDALALFKKHLGTNLAGAERNMVKHIRGLPYSDPVKNQPYFVVSAVSGTKKYATVTASMDHARTRRNLLMKMNVADRTRAQFPPIRRFPNQAVANQALALFMRSK